MTTADTFVPLAHVTFETAAEHASRNIPLAAPAATTAAELMDAEAPVVVVG